MSVFGRWVRVGVCVAAAVTGGGCAFGKKAYDADPLLHRGRGVWGDLSKANRPDPPAPEPTAPQPPLVSETFFVGDTSASP